jgi:hypothetical protein
MISRGHFQKKAPRRDGLEKSYRAAAVTRLKNYLPLPRWYSKKCFDFQAYDCFELELLLLVDLIC